jgi:L-amino acid N-acyltransferase YncA
MTVMLQAPACGRRPALLLRPWHSRDIPALIDIYRDPVMRRSARNRGVASHAVEMLTTWAFESFGAAGLRRIELLHQQDNLASCRVAQKSGYALTGVLPADPPAFPVDGHLHTRYQHP